MAKFWSISQLMGAPMSPTDCMRLFRIPFWVAKMKVKIIPEIEVAMTVGMKNAPRKKLEPRSFWLSSTAIMSASGMMMISFQKAYSKVVTTLPQKVASLNMRVKLAVPT